MKKLINAPVGVVREMLEGVAAVNAETALLEHENVVVRADLPVPAQRKVAVLSGGGSGHEPAHAGYVGRGMLTAAIAGEVFTSPDTDSVLAAIKAASGPAGALLIVKNYTGDRLNFGLAAELARAEGIPVETVVVADDVALRESVPRDRRRGIAGTVLVHKVAGAAAERGLALGEVARLARHAADNIASMGISLGACTLPAVGKPGFELGEDEIEVGLGIHGEPGVRRMGIRPADELVGLILDTFHADRPLRSGDHVGVLVNGLGATPPMELSIIAHAALSQLAARGVAVERAWTGSLLTALDMPGFSLSLIALDDDLRGLLDDATDVATWPGRGLTRGKARTVAFPAAPVAADAAAAQTALGLQVREYAIRAAHALIAAEAQLTELDSIAGDGDLGASMQRGAEAILALPAARFTDASGALASIGDALRRAIAGSSGPFYATGLLRASRRLTGIAEPTASDWADAFALAVLAIRELGGAKPGDRTMVDALQAAVDCLQVQVKQGASLAAAWQAATQAALAATEATKTMPPKAGRASYLGDRVLGHPDGGAVAVTLWMQSLAG